MKIVIGKFSNEPFHALSKKEVSLLLKLVPSEWIKPVTSVVLSSKIFKKTKLTKPVDYSSSNRRLSIYSRGLERKDIARQVLIELAAIGADQEGTDSAQTLELDKIIETFMDKFLKTRF